MSTIMKKISYLAFAATLLAPTLSFACGGACKADRERFCGNVQKGDGRIRQCMKDHYNDLSTGCRQHIDVKRAQAV